MEGRTSLREHDRMLATGIQVNSLRNLLGLLQNPKEDKQPETRVEVESGLA
jgi:hypothetical protein